MDENYSEVHPILYTFNPLSFQPLDILAWTGKSATSQTEHVRDEDLQFDFAELLTELRADLRSECEKEEHLLNEIKKELEAAVGNKGLFE